ncbi:(d)CMP kinase [Spiroplasma tabanidicola]|uniref:Cytidylate kinase n=1 Tax=Spiroplasma tabanidicola TaxID=324079 RepID=A0A6I6CBW7_9MOLU|nr:(d)CMP kinase [Spiroplasma tabanidicola]QGS51718.1 cytidylate kinase [Spiroplasma tabanidicola]
MNLKINIAVDGTASSGKSSVMMVVAKDLGFHFIDTGLMYRAYTKMCLDNKVDFNNNVKIIEQLKNFDFHYREGNQIYVGNKNYTKYLSDYDVVENIKYIATLLEVRNKMVDLQRKMAINGNKIMVGRDITTVVLPNAELKIYFDCSAETRAKRRVKQNEENNIYPNDYEDILRQIIQRDESDKNRKESPLMIAKDAWVIDTSDLTFDQVVEKVKTKVLSFINQEE